MANLWYADLCPVLLCHNGKTIRNMRKLPESYRKSLPSVKLYLDDLKAIEAIIGHQERFEIWTPGYEFANINELYEHRKAQTLSQITLGRAATVQVSIGTLTLFDNKDVSISADNIEDNAVLGMVSRVEGLLAQRSLRRLPRIAYIGTLPFLLAMLMVFLPEDTLNRWLKDLIMFAAVFWCFFAAYASRLSSIVVVDHKKDEPSFLKRRGEDLMYDIVKIVAGALIGGIATYIYSHLGK